MLFFCDLMINLFYLHTFDLLAILQYCGKSSGFGKDESEMDCRLAHPLILIC
jgi:hypothetical protein